MLVRSCKEYRKFLDQFQAINLCAVLQKEQNHQIPANKCERGSVAGLHRGMNFKYLTALKDGFIIKGKHFESLSKIAREITFSLGLNPSERERLPVTIQS